MVIRRNVLPRRTFLRGLGVTLALPWVDAMVPAFARKALAAVEPVKRLGFFYVGNGMQLEHFLPPDEGRFECSTPILAPLAPFRDDITVVSGLANAAADPLENAAGPHTRVHSVWMTGKRITNVSEGLTCATSLDQHGAMVLGKDTPLASLELALEPNFVVGLCENGFSCTYLNTFSWRTPTTPLPRETDPRVVFERLFGDVRDPAVRAAEMRKDRSILDSVVEEMKSLDRQLGPGDRTIVSEYFEAVRDVERRIENTEARAASSPTVDKPAGIPSDFGEHATLMFDMAALAYQADITRVISFQICRELSGRPYPEAGVPEAHHAVSHHQNTASFMEKCAKINAHHMQFFAGFLDKLQRTRDGDGSLLDHALLLYGAGMGNSNYHMPHDLPLLVAGGGGGQHTGGRLLKAPVDTPMMNLGLTLLDKVGVELPSIGDSTGRLAGL